MKTNFLIGGFLLAAAIVIQAATNDLTSALQKGLFEEEANHNLDSAIQAYQSVAAQFDKDRKLAATALFRLGECYRKQGNTNAATAQYQRILREFSDQPTLLTLSRQNLAALGATSTAPASAIESSMARALTTMETEEVKRIQALIKDSPDLINAKDSDGQTPLHKAAAAGQLVVAQFLVANGADIEARNSSGGRTPLHEAAAGGHKAIVELLINKKANVRAANDLGYTPLHLAAKSGYRSVVELLLARGAEVNAKDRQNTTPLLLAVTFGFRSVADLLLAQGTDVNATTVNIHTGRENVLGTALCIAARQGDQAMVELLLAKGAKVDAEDGEGRTPLSYAAEKRFSSVVKRLLEAHADPNAGRLGLPLNYVAYLGDLASLKLLLTNKANPNASTRINLSLRKRGPSSGPFTPLFLAVNTRQAEAVRELIRFKADPNSGGLENNPVLFEALSDPPTLKALLAGGADPNRRSQDNTPPLLQAVVDNDPAAVELLLAHHADANAAGKPDGKQIEWKPLHAAAQLGNKAILELLLKHGADVNGRDNYGFTPLHRAVGNRQQEAIELLLANKADPNARNSAGLTPLDLAKSQERPPGGYPGYAPMPLQPPTATAMPPRLRVPGLQNALVSAEKPSEPVSSLLRRHGAVDDLPDFSALRVMRKGLGGPWVVHKRDTNSLNRFTLLETLGAAFHNSSSALPFPDFARMKILRPDAAKPGAHKEIPAQVMTSSNTFDCAKDTWLQFGDLLDIPEREHTLGESQVQLTSEQTRSLNQCLARKVKFVVRGQPTEVTLNRFPAETYLSQALRLSPVQRILRSSSDFSRLRVTRTDPQTGKTKEIPVNAQWCWSNPSLPSSDYNELLNNDLWLRNGDIIEVPDKTD